MIGVISQQLRVRQGAERRPPQLCPEPLLIITVRELLRIEGPIADIVLPSVIESDPFESQLFHGRQRVVDLLWANRSPIAPGTPNRAFTIGWRGRRAQSLSHH